MISISEEWPKSYAHLWLLLNEFPENNFDDDGPKTFDLFSRDMLQRRKAGESLYMARQNGEVIGYVGYIPVNHRLGLFHGICFAKRVRGTGAAHKAVRMLIDDLFSRGVEKISATFFAHNERVFRFLAHLGAVEEGLLKGHTMQKNKAVDMRLVAIRKVG